MIYLDAGTTYSKIISNEDCFEKKFCVGKKDSYFYYIIPSGIIKSIEIKPENSCGHMSDAKENEIVALALGAEKYVNKEDSTVLDLGSRDAKWIRFKNERFYDMDWNTSCASSTGATVEMLLKFYNVKPDDLKFNSEKFSVTCGIFGMEKIMDSISKGIQPAEAISKFVHGIAFNAWNFAKRPEKIYLSGGFCENQCLVDSLKMYCDVELLGRFILCEGLIGKEPKH